MKSIILLVIVAIMFACGTSVGPDTSEDVPKNVTLQNNYVQEVTISWQCDNQQTLGFLIKRKQAGGEYSIIDSVDSNLNNYIDFDLVSLETYYYKVAAVFSNSRSDWSNEENVFIKSGFENLNFGEENSLEIITWNIEHFPKEGATTVDLIVQLIPVIDADIYGLQEIESNSNFEDIITSLNSKYDEHNWVGFRANSAAYDIDLAYIYKADIVQIEEIREIFISDYSREFPRKPLLMKCTWNGESVTIINNHLKALGDGNMNLLDEWDEETRRYDACNLLDEYITDSLSTDNVVIIGDLNDELIDEQQDNVFWNLLQNQTEYYFVDLVIAEGNSINWSYPSWPSHLDHIIITNELFDEFADSNSEVRTVKIDEYMESGFSEYDHDLTDHRPVGLKLFF